MLFDATSFNNPNGCITGVFHCFAGAVGNSKLAIQQLLLPLPGGPVTSLA
jgi:hypothetical protein